ncbi:MAG: hypothetical protein N3A57_08340 [Negativicutes bacterium]|nr:hypothetical protein [Negativicutes bacterium]
MTVRQRTVTPPAAIGDVEREHGGLTTAATDSNTGRADRGGTGRAMVGRRENQRGCKYEQR